jgi:hypothetical protein
VRGHAFVDWDGSFAFVSGYGGVELPAWVTETRRTYMYRLGLTPMEGGAAFDLLQDRGGERRLFEGCRVKGFELRFNRGEAVHLKLDISGELPPVVYQGIGNGE